MAPQPEVDTMTAFIGAVVKYGWPVVAAALIWNLSNTVAKDASDTKAMMSSHLERSMRFQESLDRTERLDGIIIDLLRQTCVNSASDFSQRQACFAAGSTR